MNQEQLIDIIVQESNVEISILMSKGTEYSRSEDALANFKRLAISLDISIEKVWAVYFCKHVDAILNFVKTGQVVSNETILGRIADARNYLGILYGILEDKNQPTLKENQDGQGTSNNQSHSNRVSKI